MNMKHTLFVMGAVGMSLQCPATGELETYLRSQSYPYKISFSKGQKSQSIMISAKGWVADVSLRYYSHGFQGARGLASMSASLVPDPNKTMSIDVDFAGWSNESGLVCAEGQYGVVLSRTVHGNRPLTSEVIARTDAIFRIAVQEWLLSRRSGKSSSTYVTLADEAKKSKSTVRYSDFGTKAELIGTSGRSYTFMIGYSRAYSGGKWIPLSASPKYQAGKFLIAAGDIRKLSQS